MDFAERIHDYFIQSSHETTTKQPFHALYNNLHHSLCHNLLIILFGHWKIRGTLMLSLLVALKRIKGDGSKCLHWHDCCLTCIYSETVSSLNEGITVKSEQI